MVFHLGLVVVPNQVVMLLQQQPLVQVLELQQALVLCQHVVVLEMEFLLVLALALALLVVLER
jgi:hypothetical protein